MILPIVSAIAREVISTVPCPSSKEAALALGATRWEMIRIAVLPYSRAGITGGAMLGLGRAIGRDDRGGARDRQLAEARGTDLSQGYTLAAVIATSSARRPRRPCTGFALFAAGLVLFVLTLLVNILARRYVVRSTTASAWPPTWSPEERRRERRMTELAPISSRRRRTDQSPCAACWRRNDRCPRAAGARHLLPVRTRAWSAWTRTSSPRPQRQLPRISGRDPLGDPGHDRDRRARDADLGADRDRRRPLPDRVRQGTPSSPTSCATSST